MSFFQAKDVFADVRAFLNDQANATFTDTVQLPYLNIASDELQQILEQHNIGVTNGVEIDIPITAGDTELSGLNLPDDLIEIKNIYERISGASNEYQLMQRVEFLPQINLQLAYLIYWTWNQQKIEFVGSTSDEQLKIEYIKRRLPKIINAATVIDIIGARSVLAYRTAGLCAEFIGENSDRAEALNGSAQRMLDSMLAINLKGQQAITTRRRPFRANFKFRQRLYR